MHVLSKKVITTILSIAITLTTISTAHADSLKEVRVGYTAIVPETLVAKDKGWVEEAVKPLGFQVKWVESLGSNKTIEFLRGKHLDIGPSSLASAFLARANGTLIKYVYWNLRQPSGSPILVKKESSFKSISDLKGLKIAATPGTGPYISLIAALKKHGLTENDVEIVSLQHAQGRVALASGRVAAWAGLDPDWAIAELQNNARILFADPALAGGGGIDVRDEFLTQYPDVVQAVLAGFDRARIYTLENPKEAIATFAQTSKVDVSVAERVFTRGNAAQPGLIDKDYHDLENWGNLYKEIGVIPNNTDVKAVVRDVLDASVFKPQSNK